MPVELGRYAARKCLFSALNLAQLTVLRVLDRALFATSERHGVLWTNAGNQPIPGDRHPDVLS